MNDPVKTAILKQRRTRRRSRGAAMVEGLVAIPFFITTFALSVFTGDFYTKKLQTIKETKQEVLSNASNNCSAGSINAGFEDLALGMAMNLLMGGPWTAVFTKGFSKTVKVANGSVSSKGTYYGAFTVSIKTENSMMCNEKPEDINFVTMFLWAYAKLTFF